MSRALSATRVCQNRRSSNTETLDGQDSFRLAQPTQRAKARPLCASMQGRLPTAFPHNRLAELSSWHPAGGIYRLVIL
jgi:hypothetical protein